ncbi:MAG: hypothetical protein JSU75_03355 [Gammaproteobacteria bacterium]|nr:MAG: hypothetical protein JSU75_03355 [Gammaproteobacteria bacterium]
MHLPKPLYEAKPYLYLLTGILVAVTWGFSPFSVIGSAALIIGSLYIIYLRYMYRKKARAEAEASSTNATTETNDISEKAPEDQSP